MRAPLSNNDVNEANEGPGGSSIMDQAAEPSTGLFADPSDRADSTLPFYRETNSELATFEHAWRNRLPLLIKGPTGCGKSRFVEHMAARLGRPLVTVACNEDTGATDLLGRHLLKGGETIWCDGPLTRAVRTGAILYLDEVAEARPDVLVSIHPLTDHRRTVYLDRLGEEISAPPEFMLVASYNPGYQNSLKELKPSTRQRFISIAFDFPEKDAEIEVIIKESGVDPKLAERLVKFAQKLRLADELGLSEAPSTRLLVNAGKLMKAGMPTRAACDTAVTQLLSDETELNQAMNDIASLIF